MMESANLWERDDLTAISVVDRSPVRRILLERQVRASAIVVARVVQKNSTEMSLVENDDVVQALAAQRPDESLRVGVLPR